MERIDELDDALIDLRVPANLASRYRVRLTEVTPRHARLELAFLPVLFRTGVLTSCPADLTVVVGTLVIQVRGVFRMDEDSAITAQFDYDGAIGPRELELMRWRGTPEESEPADTHGRTEESPLLYAS